MSKLFKTSVFSAFAKTIMAIAAVGLVACNEDKNEVVETESSEYPPSSVVQIVGL